MSDDSVHKGKEGWLFLTGGANRALRFYTEQDAFSQALVNQWLERIRSRRDRCERMGVRYVHLIAPDKLTIYHEFFDGILPHRELSPARALPKAARLAGLDSSLVDVVPALNQRKREQQLYWKTDTHWNFFGCSAAYKMLCEHLRVSSSTALDQGSRRSVDALLDLGSKLVPPMHERIMLIDFCTNAIRHSANALVEFKERHRRENDVGLHVGSNVVFRNEASGVAPETAVLFGTSFSEYRPRLLTGMLAETFRELHFVWSTSIDWSYVERVQATLVITESAERFMGAVPEDCFNLDAHVHRQLTQLQTV